MNFFIRFARPYGPKRYIGGIDDNYKDATLVKTNYVEDAIEALKKGNLIKQTTTRAIGCSIKL